jgi:hypothetical protein
MKRIVLHIDQLILRGVARGDARALSMALQGELQRLLALPGGLAALQARQGAQGPQGAQGTHDAHGAQDPHGVKSAQVRVQQGAGPAAIGRAVAGGVVAGGKP